MAFARHTRRVMRVQYSASDVSILQRLGERLSQHRLALNLSQEQVAEQAGVGIRTVQRMESGEAATQLSSFVRVCRALGLLERLEAMLPEPAASPIAQLKLQGRGRQRASRPRGSESSRVAESTPGEPKKPWQWGEPS